jgi:hypothetical protein
LAHRKPITVSHGNRSQSVIFASTADDQVHPHSLEA